MRQIDRRNEKINSKYLLDFYLKDFKYLSPEALGVHSIKDGKVIGTAEEPTYKVLVKMWASQVVRGIKLLFCQGSLHGMKYIFDPTFSRKERFTWIVIMMISIGICAGNITQLFSNWTSTPFVNVIDSLPSPVWAVPIPTVVLCPHLDAEMYIFEPTFSGKERFTWIVIMMISIGICAGNITQLFSKWTSTPFVNVIDSLPSPVWAVPFPNVVLCPHLDAEIFMYIFEPTFSRKERFTWIVIMMISIGICAGNITQLFSKWTSTPFVNVIDSLPSPVWAVPFPTVVLCPHLHVKLSYKNVSQLNDLEKFYASLVCPHMTKEHKALDERLSLEQSKELDDFILKGSPKCPDVVKSCYWRATSDAAWVTKECCGKLFRPIFTNYGLCFAFNSLPLNGMTNVTLPWQRTFNQDALQQRLNWGLDAGYPKVFPPDPDMLPYRVMASGEANGLGVELYLNASEYQVDCDGGSVGFNVIISSPTDHVYTSTIIRLPMDRMTTIEVYPITYKTDSSLRALLPDRRQCFFQNERHLEYYEFYTDSNCKHDLLIREARKVCNCVYYNWPRRSAGEPICATISDFHCINDVKAKVEEQLIYAYFADSEEQRRPTGTSSSCHPACNDVIYNSQVFYSDLKHGPNEPSKEPEITRINVHFYDDSFLGQHRHAQYDDYYFVGAIGGLLSLFLGFSIISVAELVYFVILRPLHVVFMEIWHRRRN